MNIFKLAKKWGPMTRYRDDTCPKLSKSRALKCAYVLEIVSQRFTNDDASCRVAKYIMPRIRREFDFLCEINNSDTSLILDAVIYAYEEIYNHQDLQHDIKSIIPPDMTNLDNDFGIALHKYTSIRKLKI